MAENKKQDYQALIPGKKGRKSSGDNRLPMLVGAIFIIVAISYAMASSVGISKKVFEVNILNIVHTIDEMRAEITDLQNQIVELENR